MQLDSLEKVLAGEPEYRFNQANQLIFRDLIESWSEATIFPEKLRRELAGRVDLRIQAKTYVSKDGTVKALFELSDGCQIEAVLMRHRDGRNTICISSQVGCPLGCLFCATGQLGFKRNLTVAEITDQVLFFSRLLKKKGSKVTNIVFMGMGEPFLNYDNVVSSIKILNDPEYFGLGSRRISVSTVGIPQGIRKFSREKLECNLAISLHAPNDQLRSGLMPINTSFPLVQVFKTVDEYIQKTKRRVMFEYILLDGVNDSPLEAQQLAELLRGRLYHLNLIPYNPTGKFLASSSVRLPKFKEILRRFGVKFTQRHRFGTDIDAACGQLALKVPKKLA